MEQMRLFERAGLVLQPRQLAASAAARACDAPDGPTAVGSAMKISFKPRVRAVAVDGASRKAAQRNPVMHTCSYLCTFVHNSARP